MDGQGCPGPPAKHRSPLRAAMQAHVAQARPAVRSVYGEKLNAICQCELYERRTRPALALAQWHVSLTSKHCSQTESQRRPHRHHHIFPIFLCHSFLPDCTHATRPKVKTRTQAQARVRPPCHASRCVQRQVVDFVERRKDACSSSRS